MMTRFGTRLAPFLVIALALCQTAPAKQSVINSKHNLSVSVVGAAPGDDCVGLCSFCHVPHGAVSPDLLWARPDSSAAYQPYRSESMRATVGQPTGTSKRCLSCHDGTLALLPSSHSKSGPGGGRTLDAHSPANLGTDLSDDQPISFSYRESISGGKRELAPASALTENVRLDDTGQMQCTTCHDPHDDTFGHFLVMSNQNGDLCAACHTMEGYTASSHQNISRPRDVSLGMRSRIGDTDDLDRTSCNACHVPHNARSKETLLIAEQSSELCLACHDGSGKGEDVAGDLRNMYSHPVGESPDAHSAGERAPVVDGHAECVDCHNAHQSDSRKTMGGELSGALLGVDGISESGSPVERVVREYEICFKCHSRGARKSFSHITRQIDTTDTRRQFSASAASRHPVVAMGRQASIPSLMRNLGPIQQMTCSDCHSGDSARGPHGSRYPFILSEEYRTGDDVVESPQSYDLCYRCHDRSSILAGDSFTEHRRHIVDQRASCAVCHDAHGVPSDEGDPSTHERLINFDLSIVGPEALSGQMEFIHIGQDSGACSLNCHGENHERRNYGGE
jgi:predicted CXXCH cytochrome family protein